MQKYMEDAFNQQIVEDVAELYQEVCCSIPDEEKENVKIEVSAELFCCMAELLSALLSTYEGYGYGDEASLVLCAETC